MFCNGSHGASQSYIIDMHSNGEFYEIKGINGLARNMIETVKKYFLSSPSILYLT